MAFVKLPEAMRDLEIHTLAGEPVRVELTVFAGETVRLSERLADDGERLSSLWVRSPRAEQRFDFEELPTPFSPGDVVGVVAAIPDGREDGPILSTANLDADRRVDFLDQERELLLLLSGLERDHRTGGIARAAASALVRAGLVGLVAWFALAAATVYAALGAVPFDGGALSALGAVATAGLEDPTPVAIAMIGATLSFLSFLTFGALREARLARRQTDILRQLWRRVGETLGFVQHHADAFRVKKLPQAPAEPPQTRPQPTARAARRPAARAPEPDAVDEPPRRRRAAHSDDADRTPAPSGDVAPEPTAARREPAMRPEPAPRRERAAATERPTDDDARDWLESLAERPAPSERAAHRRTVSDADQPVARAPRPTAGGAVDRPARADVADRLADRIAARRAGLREGRAEPGFAAPEPRRASQPRDPLIDDLRAARREPRRRAPRPSDDAAPEDRFGRFGPRPRDRDR